MSDHRTAYSWDAAQIGYESKEPIEYQPQDKKTFCPVEDGQQQGNFSGQIFRELSERQTEGELGLDPILRERAPRDSVGLNFSLPNDKKYKIGSVERVLERQAIKRVASRYLKGE